METAQTTTRTVAVASVTALALLMALLMFVSITTAQQAAAACTGGPPPAAATGTLRVAQANIPATVSHAGFTRSLKPALAQVPDFLTLTSQAGRGLEEITAAASGFDAYRDPDVAVGPGAHQSLDTVVLWRSHDWERIDGGRVKLVDDDLTRRRGGDVVTDRFATWVTLRRHADSAVVSVVSVHHMLNPARVGPDKPARQERYAVAMDTLIQLLDHLPGVVVVGGNLNVGGQEATEPWSAPAKMSSAGYQWHTAGGGDYLFVPASVALSATAAGQAGPSGQWLAASLTPEGSAAEPTSSAAPKAAQWDAVQLRNAVAIVDAGREAHVAPRGQAIALMTAIGESGLRVLDHGDTAGPDSRGLFQQRDNGAWGSLEDRMDPRISSLNFYAALKRVPGWETMEPTLAAHQVQRNAGARYYQQFWERALALLDDITGSGQAAAAYDCAPPGGAPLATVATLNLLGAGHTQGGQRPGFPGWQVRLPAALNLLSAHGVTIAAVQEAHHPQAQALATTYRARWGMYPSGGPLQNRVIWDRGQWTQQAARTVKIPYFHGHLVPMPMVKLTSTTTGESLWVWSIHNPANANGPALAFRKAALAIEKATMAQLAAGGDRVVLAGDFNDGRDGTAASTCVLMPALASAADPASGSCANPDLIDHLYGANLTWGQPNVDRSTKTSKITDHPLVTATVMVGGAGGDVVYPVPAGMEGTDRHNWGDSGGHWSSWHTGTDFSVPCGTPVLAAHDGAVQIDRASWSGRWLVKVTQGPKALTTWYAHMQAVDVNPGQVVTAGTALGRVGAEGNATGCHLHFEVHLANGSIYGSDNTNPSTWLETHTKGARTGRRQQSSQEAA